MKISVKTAVILAAGVGRRLKDVVADYPKGFIKLGQLPIIEESIQKILASGIEEIIIVTGFASQHYDQLAAKYKAIQTIKNEKFAESGSMYSLAIARKLIQGDFILFESDLVYEKRGLLALQSCVYDNCILLSGATNSGDEVYVDVVNQRVGHISKKREEIKSLGGELVGVTKISLALFQKMLMEADQYFKTNLNWEYDSGCLSKVAKSEKIYATKIQDLLWAEVDNQEHLTRAKEKIYPQIIMHEQNLTAKDRR